MAFPRAPVNPSVCLFADLIFSRRYQKVTNPIAKARGARRCRGAYLVSGASVQAGVSFISDLSCEVGQRPMLCWPGARFHQLWRV